jgi:hypothetical protein
MKTKHPKPVGRFAICVDTDDPDLLTPRMVYQVLPDTVAAESNYLRIVDNEGEDYLYPAKYFVLVKLPQQVKRTLLALLLQRRLMRVWRTRRRTSTLQQTQLVVAAGHARDEPCNRRRRVRC